jgi:heme/copper-type cytochrome/quinol oxidase subunit 2
MLRAVAVALVTFLLTAAPALADNGGIAPVEPNSPNAQGITDAYWLILAITGAAFIVVETILVVFLVKYRSRGRTRDVGGAQTHGHTRLEIAWTLVPVALPRRDHRLHLRHAARRSRTRPPPPAATSP